MKNRALLFVILFLCCFLNGCGKAKEEKKENVNSEEINAGNRLVLLTGSRAFCGRELTISFYAQDEISGNVIMEKCLALGKKLDNTFNRSKRGSELDTMNHRNDRRVQMSDEMAELVAEGLHWYALTEGKLDITVAPLLELWNFDSENACVPDAAQIIDCASILNAESVHVSGTIISFDYSDTMLDLSTFADGYTVDLIRDELRNAGITSGMVQVGNTAYGIGLKADGTKWLVKIPKPGGGADEYLQMLDCTDMAVSTTSIYDRYFEQDGILYHYLLDTESGTPVHYGFLQATVTGNSALQAQAMSAGCMLMGEESGNSISKQIEGIHRIYWVSNNGEFS